MEQAKLIRRQRKAVITRHLGNLERFVSEEDVEEVVRKLEQLSASFKDFEAAHDVYHAQLDDETEIEASEKLFQDVESSYIQKIKAVRTWLKTQGNEQPKKVDVSVTNGDAASTADLVNLLSIPKVELDKFDGNPLDYQSFIAIFDEIVDSKIDDDNVKLTRLLQYTSGSAKDAIKNCALVGGTEGYRQAREILKNRYGNPHLVSQRIIGDLKNGKHITKANELQQLADELSMALTA